MRYQFFVISILVYLGNIQKLSASQLVQSRQKKHTTPAMRKSFDKLFSGALFNDETVEQQRKKMLDQKTAEFIDFFKKNPSFITQKNSAGDTPLLRLVKQGITIELFGANQEDISPEIVPPPLAWITILLDQGAQPDEADSAGKQMLDYLEPEETDSEEFAEYRSNAKKIIEDWFEQHYASTKGAVATSTALPQRIDSIVAEYITTSPQKKKKQAKKNDHE